MVPLRVPIFTPELQQLISNELRSGEKLVWAAQPLPRVFRRQSIGIVLFGIPWTAFAIFWMTTAAWGVWGHGGYNHAGSNLPGPFVFFPLFGLPFVLIGLGMLSSPFWLSRQARRTVYVLSDQRAIVITGKALGGGVTVQSFEPDRLTSMERSQRADGSGDLVFESFVQRQGRGSNTIRRGFIGIENVKQVEELIRESLLLNRAAKV
jgi:hypothetical protein